MSESVKSESTTNIDETEVPAAAAEQSNNDIVLNEDCGDLNADNQSEGNYIKTSPKFSLKLIRQFNKVF